MSSRVGDPEHDLVDAESDHRPNEIDVRLEAVLVDLDLVGDELLAEVRHHRILDREVAADGLPARGLTGYARVALGRKFLRVVLERRTCIEHPSEPARVEAFERPRHP